MEKYRRVVNSKPDVKIEENEIRITTSGKPRSFISYATNLFKDKEAEVVVLKAMGRAITKTVMIAEIIKRRIPGLHQITVIDSTDIVDTWEPLEEGLDVIETTKHVSSIIITLSTAPLDSSQPGYQSPLPDEQVKVSRPRSSSDRGEFRGKGGKGGDGGYRSKGEGGPGRSSGGTGRTLSGRGDDDYGRSYGNRNFNNRGGRRGFNNNRNFGRNFNNQVGNRSSSRSYNNYNNYGGGGYNSGYNNNYNSGMSRRRGLGSGGNANRSRRGGNRRGFGGGGGRNFPRDSRGSNKRDLRDEDKSDESDSDN